MSESSASRAYGGLSAEERRGQRRAALLQAGRALWSELGWTGVTMRAVCARAGLTDRYFYESFADRDALRIAVMEEIRDEGFALIIAAVHPSLDEPPLVQLRSALKAVLDFVAADDAAAQIFFGDHGGSEVLGDLRRQMIGGVVDMFIALTGSRLIDKARREELRATLILGIGGFVEAAAAWRAKTIAVSSDELIEMLINLAERIAAGLITLD